MNDAFQNYQDKLSILNEELEFAKNYDEGLRELNRNRQIVQEYFDNKRKIESLKKFFSFRRKSSN